MFQVGQINLKNIILLDWGEEDKYEYSKLIRRDQLDGLLTSANKETGNLRACL